MAETGDKLNEGTRSEKATMQFEFQNPTRLIFGAGTLSRQGDVVIALGGGSTMDAAKVMAVPETGAPVEAPTPEEEEALVFPLVAFAATLCIAALVYIMVAQALGIHLPLPASMLLH